MDDKKFPKIKKSIEDFIYEEEGNMNIYRILNILNIKYKLLEHPPVCTRKDAKVIKDKLNGTECNNYFVKDQKGNYF